MNQDFLAKKSSNPPTSGAFNFGPDPATAATAINKHKFHMNMELLNQQTQVLTHELQEREAFANVHMERSKLYSEQQRKLHEHSASAEGDIKAKRMRDPADDLGPITCQVPPKFGFPNNQLGFGGNINQGGGSSQMHFMAAAAAAQQVGQFPNMLNMQNPAAIQQQQQQINMFHEQLKIQSHPIHHSPNMPGAAAANIQNFAQQQQQQQQQGNPAANFPMQIQQQFTQNSPPGFSLSPGGGFIHQSSQLPNPMMPMQNAVMTRPQNPLFAQKNLQHFYQGHAAMMPPGAEGNMTYFGMEPAWREAPPTKQRKKRARSKKKLNSILERTSPCPNVDVRHIQRGAAQSPAPPVTTAVSFLENPTAFLAQQTALMNSSMPAKSSPQQTPIQQDEDSLMSPNTIANVAMTSPTGPLCTSTPIDKAAPVSLSSPPISSATMTASTTTTSTSSPDTLTPLTTTASSEIATTSCSSSSVAPSGDQEVDHVVDEGETGEGSSENVESVPTEETPAVELDAEVSSPAPSNAAVSEAGVSAAVVPLPSNLPMPSKTSCSTRSSSASVATTSTVASESTNQVPASRGSASAVLASQQQGAVSAATQIPASMMHHFELGKNSPLTAQLRQEQTLSSDQSHPSRPKQPAKTKSRPNILSRQSNPSTQIINSNNSFSQNLQQISANTASNNNFSTNAPNSNSGNMTIQQIFSQRSASDFPASSLLSAAARAQSANQAACPVSSPFGQSQGFAAQGQQPQSLAQQTHHPQGLSMSPNFSGIMPVPQGASFAPGLITATAEQIRPISGLNLLPQANVNITNPQFINQQLLNQANAAAAAAAATAAAVPTQENPMLQAIPTAAAALAGTGQLPLPLNITSSSASSVETLLPGGTAQSQNSVAGQQPQQQQPQPIRPLAPTSSTALGLPVTSAAAAAKEQTPIQMVQNMISGLEATQSALDAVVAMKPEGGNPRSRRSNSDSKSSSRPSSVSRASFSSDGGSSQCDSKFDSSGTLSAEHGVPYADGRYAEELQQGMVDSTHTGEDGSGLPMMAATNDINQLVQQGGLLGGGLPIITMNTPMPPMSVSGATAVTNSLTQVIPAAGIQQQLLAQQPVMQLVNTFGMAAIQNPLLIQNQLNLVNADGMMPALNPLEQQMAAAAAAQYSGNQMLTPGGHVHNVMTQGAHSIIHNSMPQVEEMYPADQSDSMSNASSTSTPVSNRVSTPQNNSYQQPQSVPKLQMMVHGDQKPAKRRRERNRKSSTPTIASMLQAQSAAANQVVMVPSMQGQLVQVVNPLTNQVHVGPADKAGTQPLVYFPLGAQNLNQQLLSQGQGMIPTPQGQVNLNQALNILPGGNLNPAILQNLNFQQQLIQQSLQGQIPLMNTTSVTVQTQTINEDAPTANDPAQDNNGSGCGTDVNQMVPMESADPISSMETDAVVSSVQSSGSDTDSLSTVDAIYKAVVDAAHAGVKVVITDEQTNTVDTVHTIPAAQFSTALQQVVPNGPTGGTPATNSAVSALITQTGALNAISALSIADATAKHNYSIYQQPTTYTSAQSGTRRPKKSRKSSQTYLQDNSEFEQELMQGGNDDVIPIEKCQVPNEEEDEEVIEDDEDVEEIEHVEDEFEEMENKAYTESETQSDKVVILDDEPDDDEDLVEEEEEEIPDGGEVEELVKETEEDSEAELEQNYVIGGGEEQEEEEEEEGLSQDGEGEEAIEQELFQGEEQNEIDNEPNEVQDDAENEPVENPSQVGNLSRVENPGQVENPDHMENPSQVENPSQLENLSQAENPGQVENPTPVENPDLVGDSHPNADELQPEIQTEENTEPSTGASNPDISDICHKEGGNINRETESLVVDGEQNEVEDAPCDAEDLVNDSERPQNIEPDNPKAASPLCEDELQPPSEQTTDGNANRLIQSGEAENLAAKKTAAASELADGLDQSSFNSHEGQLSDGQGERFESGGNSSGEEEDHSMEEELDADRLQMTAASMKYDLMSKVNQGMKRSLDDEESVEGSERGADDLNDLEGEWAF